jgi:transposase
MQTLVVRGCGLDVHQASVVACLLIALKDVRTFDTTTLELRAAHQKGSGSQDRRQGCGTDCRLLCHVLLRFSSVPPKPVRELCGLTRYCRKLVESQAEEPDRLLKLLETANIKLASMVTAVLGGKAAPQEVAELAKRRLRQKIHELEPALNGKLR